MNWETTISTNVAADAAGEADLHRILDVLPHRPPFLFVERLIDVVPGERATGIKTVSANEEFFQGHFPQKPVMPGVLILEALAQTAAALVMHSLNWPLERVQNCLIYFMSVESCRFRRPVEPGAVLKLHVIRQQVRGNVWKFEGRAEVDSIVVTEARFTAMIAEQE